MTEFRVPTPKELQNLIGYRVDNIYRDLTDTFYLFKFKGKGLLKNPFLLIEPGIRIHLTEVKHPVPERPPRSLWPTLAQRPRQRRSSWRLGFGRSA